MKKSLENPTTTLVAEEKRKFISTKTTKNKNKAENL
jgi:hypothetical protein